MCMGLTWKFQNYKQSHLSLALFLLSHMKNIESALKIIKRKSTHVQSDNEHKMQETFAESEFSSQFLFIFLVFWFVVSVRFEILKKKIIIFTLNQSIYITLKIIIFTFTYNNDNNYF